MEVQDFRGLTEAYLQVYTEPEISEEAMIAAQYFYEQGLNEDGVGILIEEIGLDDFNDWVFDIIESYELIEARRSGRIEPVTKTGKSVGQLKGGAKSAAIRRLRGEKEARRSSEAAASASKPSGLKAALKSQAVTAAASKQASTPKTEKPSETQRGIGGLIGSALRAATEKGKKDIASVQQSWKTLRDTGEDFRKAMETIRSTRPVKTAERKAIVAAQRGARRVVNAGAAAAGAGYGTYARTGSVPRALGRAAGTAVRRYGELGTKKEDFELWVNTLINEGYDLSEYTWDDMWNLYEDAVENVPVRSQPLSKESSMLAELIRIHGPKEGMKKFKKMIRKEDYEFIVSYLLDEGFADSYVAAESIMESMSPEWFDMILDEAKQ